MEKYRVTEVGYHALEVRIKDEEKKLSELLLQKQDAAKQGDDWHDNPAFDQLEMEERGLRRTIFELRRKFNNAVIIDEKSEGGTENAVGIGSIVYITVNGEKTEKRYQIVDPEMIDPNNGIISYASPLAKAIMGAMPGEEREYSVRDRNFKVKIERLEVKE